MFYEHFLMLYKNEANTFWDTHKYLKKKKHSVLHINRLSVNIYKEDIDTSSRFCLEDVLLFLFKSKSMLTNFELENLKQWKKVFVLVQIRMKIMYNINYQRCLRNQKIGGYTLHHTYETKIIVNVEGYTSFC